MPQSAGTTFASVIYPQSLEQQEGEKAWFPETHIIDKQKNPPWRVLFVTLT